MRRFVRHPITNLSGIGATILFCAEQFFSELLTVNEIDVPWGWVAIALGCIWIGAQVRQWENRDHFLQEWWAAKRRFVILSSVRRQGANDESEYYVDLTFTQHVSNIIVSVEAFRAEMRYIEPRAWMRRFSYTPIQRSDCNKGGKESLKLIFTKNGEPEQRDNALNALLQVESKPPKFPANWELMIRVTVTAAGKEPYVEDFHFWWLNNELHQLPKQPPDILVGGDDANFKEGCAGLWITQ